MQDQLIWYFQEYEQYAILFSIGVSIIVAVLGVVPSFFVTAANLMFFGFWTGTLISFIGESVGAIIAFYLYRKGFKKFSEKPLSKYPKLEKLVHTEGREAFLLILSLRMLPFVPSGLVTLAGAIGSVSFITFAVASSIGKIPALLIEAYSVHQVLQFEWQGKIILSVASIYLIYIVIKKRSRVNF